MPGLPKLSSPLTDLPDHDQVVVVGTGYGGSITASRLARAGQSVCVLEQGRELRPGEYPRSAHEATPHVQVDAAEGHVGDRRALYSFHVGQDINVFHGCGLGGTSLVNARHPRPSRSRIARAGAHGLRTWRDQEPLLR